MNRVYRSSSAQSVARCSSWWHTHTGSNYARSPKLLRKEIFSFILNCILIKFILPYHTQHTAQQTGNIILLFDQMKDFYHGSQFYLQTNEEQSNLGKPNLVVLMIACGFWVLLWSSLTKNNYTIIFCFNKRLWSTSFKIGKYQPLCQL